MNASQRMNYGDSLRSKLSNWDNKCAFMIKI